MAEAVRWGRRGARVNTISPGIIITPLAKDEIAGPRGPGFRRMIDGSPVKRAGTPDEVAIVAALLMGPDGAFITGSDVLLDGGVTASHCFGDPAPKYARGTSAHPAPGDDKAVRKLPFLYLSTLYVLCIECRGNQRPHPNH